MADEAQSDFGSGFTYCIGLFLCHVDKIQHDRESWKRMGDEEQAYRMWFYTATDHLFDMQIPESLPEKLRQRAESFRKRTLSLRLPMDGPGATKKDFEWATTEAQDLLREVDALLAVPTIKAHWK